MICYLVKLEHKKSCKIQYKRGITKWQDPLKRFLDKKYDIFNITVLTKFSYNHGSYDVAKAVVNTFEQVLNAQWPPKDKNFNVEEYLGEEKGTLDDSGVTEFIYLKDDQTEKDLVDHFELSKQNMWKVK